ncbi:MAG: alpha/beta hydrolase [Rhodospirillaceae bacterium]|nr:alpha/beta hydrolase [Rhodospirillaceae bacterium]
MTSDQAPKISRRALAAGAAAIAALNTQTAQAQDTPPPVKYKPNPAPAPITLPKMKRGYAEGPYGQIHYQDGANGGTPLVLIHQAPMSSRQFESVFKPFMDRGIRPIAVDCPGFGMSDTTTFVPKVEDWAKIVPPVLDHLGLKTVDVLGHHTGALVATEVEQQFRDRVRKLILAGPFPMTETERENFLNGVQRNEIDFVYKPDGSHLTASFMSRFRMYSASGTNPDAKLMTRYTVERFVGYGPFWYGHHAAFIYNHNASIPKIKRPTLIITNTGDQIYQNAKETMKMRPDFSFAELQGGGVDIIDQQPEAWAEAIAKFLKA